MATMAWPSTEPLTFSQGSLLALKLSAFLVMLVGHVDWFFFGGQGVHQGLGRLVFPVFGVIMAYNMSRTDPAKLLRVVVPRLLLAGAVAHLPYAYLTGAQLPLNILFTMAASVACFALVQQRRLGAAVAGVLIFGLLVDYAWFGIAGVVLTAIAFASGHRGYALLAMVWFAVMLWPVNGNMHALLAVPVLYLASRVDLGDAPRLKWFFWIGYPMHAIVLATIKLAVPVP